MSETNHDAPTPDEPETTEAELDFDIPAHLTDEALDGAQIKKLAEERVAELTAEIEQMKERELRLAADLENTRRRAEKERTDALRYGIQKFAGDLLSVSDNFTRALELAPASPEGLDQEKLDGFVNGIRMTEKELMTVFERHGITKEEPKGEKFDPNKHQAIAQVPGNGEAKDYVVDVAAPGFLIGDRVVRPAMVTVSTGANASTNVKEDSSGGGSVNQTF